MIFIAQYTTIRVPKLLHFSDEDGAASVTMERVPGKPMDDLVLTLSEEDQEKLTSNISSYIKEIVTPQLNNLTSNIFDTVRGKLIPPERMRSRDRERLN